jgi:hypothetical protein
MIDKPSRFAVSAAIAAVLSLAATPVMAAGLPGSAGLPRASVTADIAVQGTAQNGRGHYRGRHHRDDGIDAGDVLAGVLILGGIAAIASAASNSSDQRDYREPQYREPQYREPVRSGDYYRDQRPDYQQRSYQDGRGMDNAVDMCVGQVERGQDRVADIADAARGADGWRIAGRLQTGEGFNCWIDNEGRIRSVDFGSGNYPDQGSYAPAQDRQYDDDYYARARAGTEYAADNYSAADQYPRYPG